MCDQCHMGKGGWTVMASKLGLQLTLCKSTRKAHFSVVNRDVQKEFLDS